MNRSRPPGFWRDGRAILLGGIVVVGLVTLIFQRRQRVLAPESPAAISAGADADGDGLPDPLPVQRLAAHPLGGPVLDAMAAAGGWAAWSRHESVSFQVDGVFFDERGVVVGRRSERCLMTLRTPQRIRIESLDGSGMMGLGGSGAWGAGRADNGLVAAGHGPGALPADQLRALLLEAAWLFRLPFNLGDIEARLEAPAAPAAIPDGSDLVDDAAATGFGGTGGEDDSLTRTIVVYPPAPGDTTGRRYELGFDPADGLLREVRFWRQEELYRFELFEPLDEEGLLVSTRRRLSRLDPAGQAIGVLHEQQLADFEWDPPIDESTFEPPESP